MNVEYKRCGLSKTRLRHPSLPFDSLPYPTLTICRRVRTYIRSITWQPNEKRLTIFYEYGGSVPRALLRACGGPAINQCYINVELPYLWNIFVLLSRKRFVLKGLQCRFLIGRYVERRESFDLFAVKFDGGAMWFSMGNSLRRWSPFKKGFLHCPSLIRNSKRRTQNPSKSLIKPLLRQMDDYIPQVGSPKFI